MKRLLTPFLFCAAFAVASPAFAQAPSTGLDSKKPVEINADTLEVLQQENKAIFTGNVIAVQDETRLRSEKMVVHYRQRDENADADPTQSTVERIEVFGNVVLTTPDEIATGDKGVYEVAIKQVKLLNNVVLKRGDSVLKGDSLVYDFTTGKSVINSPLHTPAATKAGGGRVKALFIPDEKEE